MRLAVRLSGVGAKPMLRIRWRRLRVVRSAIGGFSKVPKGKRLGNQRRVSKKEIVYPWMSETDIQG